MNDTAESVALRDVDYGNLDASTVHAASAAKTSLLDYEFELLLCAPAISLARSHVAALARDVSIELTLRAEWPAEWESAEFAAFTSPGTTSAHRDDGFSDALFDDRCDDEYGFDHEYSRRFATEEPEVATHAVLFFDDEATRLREVVNFASDGIRAGESVFLALTSPIAESLRAALPADVLALASQSESLTIVEAQETLGLLVRDGALDPAAFEAHVVSTVRRFREERGPVRVYGEMVTLLWSDGNVVAAFQLEQLWNELQKQFAVTVLCAYPLALVAEGSEEFASVSGCHNHTVVL